MTCTVPVRRRSGCCSTGPEATQILGKGRLRMMVRCLVIYRLGWSHKSNHWYTDDCTREAVAPCVAWAWGCAVVLVATGSPKPEQKMATRPHTIQSPRTQNSKGRNERGPTKSKGSQKGLKIRKPMN
ncbi:hypothetical protein BDA96_03G416500 [Sorghum bicolor]|uniref:Uncharacterized protein n=1 Tax=Sorghum bicolor TaxID=4558 RepID=A0A921UQB0_SORBI|nr:hypothetical protein BDA96_03G416500 [Sorghum bicolor]